PARADDADQPPFPAHGGPRPALPPPGGLRPRLRRTGHTVGGHDTRTGHAPRLAAPAGPGPRRPSTGRPGSGIRFGPGPTPVRRQRGGAAAMNTAIPARTSTGADPVRPFRIGAYGFVVLGAGHLVFTAARASA